jgi:hypothetical protein
MKGFLFKVLTPGLLTLTLTTALVSSCQAREIYPVAAVAACSKATNSLVLSLTEKKVQVVVSSTTVKRPDNPTARKKVLGLVIGPAPKSSIDALEDAWASAQDVVASLTLSQVESIMAGCPDVADVHVGLQQSDFIREFVVTKEGASTTRPAVVERACVEDSVRTKWHQQYCL